MSTAVSAGTYLHHIQLQSSDPARLAKFYADAMDMAAQRLESERASAVTWDGFAPANGLRSL